MYPYRPSNFPTQMPMHRPMMQPISHFPMQQMRQGFQPGQSRGFGNLLSKILGKGNAPTKFGSFPGGGGFPNGGTFPGHGAFPGTFTRGFTPGIGGGQLMSGGGSGLSGLMGNFTSGGIPEMLNNLQRVMGMAQQFGPMIQQYGPFIKNMPAMLKIMKELNNSDSSSETENENTNDDQANMEAFVEKELPDFSNIKVVETIENTVKPSKPKLYI